MTPETIMCVFFLLDVTAAFYMVGHSILLARWQDPVDICGSALEEWFARQDFLR